VTSAIEFIKIESAGRRWRIEHQWIARERVDRPLIVFLHEGLGSLSAWKDFPQQLCDACACRGLVYSRPGYGRSTPRAPGETWPMAFMHAQAYEVLPALLRALAIDATDATDDTDTADTAATANAADKPWLFGHSDGGSIALLYAARFASHVVGTVVLAPHIKVEAFGLIGIRAAREAYLHGDLKHKLARHHQDPDSAFWGWNTIWLDPAFAAWTIEAELAHITGALLAVQGVQDQYGTMAQIDGIALAVPQTALLKLQECGHSPHRDQPQAVIAAVSEFMQRHTPVTPSPVTACATSASPARRSPQETT
jgi:pimeloyl-ACP methyl ester carboxylesterase